MRVFLFALLACLVLGTLRAQEAQETPAEDDEQDEEDDPSIDDDEEMEDEAVDDLLDEAMNQHDDENRGADDVEDDAEVEDGELDEAINSSIDETLQEEESKGEDEVSEEERGFFKKIGKKFKSWWGGRRKKKIAYIRRIKHRVFLAFRRKINRISHFGSVKYKGGKKWGFHKGFQYSLNRWRRKWWSIARRGGKYVIRLFRRMYARLRTKINLIKKKVKAGFNKQTAIVGKPILPHCSAHSQCEVKGTEEEKRKECGMLGKKPLEAQGVLGCEWDECCKMCKCEGVSMCATSKKRSIKNKSCLAAKKKTCLLKGKQVLGC